MFQREVVLRRSIKHYSCNFSGPNYEQQHHLFTISASYVSRAWGRDLTMEALLPMDMISQYLWCNMKSTESFKNYCCWSIKTTCFDSFINQAECSAVFTPDIRTTHSTCLRYIILYTNTRTYIYYVCIDCQETISGISEIAKWYNHDRLD